MKNYSDEIFMDKLRTIKFPDNSDYHPLELIKSGFDFNILNAIRNRDNYYK